MVIGSVEDAQISLNDLTPDETRSKAFREL